MIGKNIDFLTLSLHFPALRPYSLGRMLKTFLECIENGKWPNNFFTEIIFFQKFLYLQSGWSYQ